MLQRIREHIQGWVAGVLIAVIGIAFVFWGVQYYFEQMRSSQAPIAKVDGQKITRKDFNQFFQRLQRSQKINVSTLSSAQQQQFKQMALQTMITNAALLQTAGNDGFRVSLAQAQQLVVAMPILQVKGRFSEQRLQQLLYANQMTMQQFFSNLQDSLLTNQVSSGIQATNFVLPNELQQSYRLIHQKRSIGYFIIDTSKFNRQMEVTDAQVKTFYQQHSDAFKIPAKVQVSYLMLSPQKIVNTIKITDKQVKQYYVANQTNYTVPKRWQIEEIVAKLSATTAQNQKLLIKQNLQRVAKKAQAGKSLSALVKGKANTSATKKWVSVDQVSGLLLQSLNQLKAGGVSQLIQTPQGYVLIKVLQVQPAKLRSFASVQANIKKMLAHQQAQQIFSKLSEELNNLTYTNPNTLSVAAKALNQKVEVSPLITRRGAKNGLFKNPKVLAVVFSEDVFKNGDNSNPIELKNGSVLVLRVSKKIPSKQREFKLVQARIKSQLVKEQAQRQAGLIAFNVQNALVNGATPSKLAKQFKLRWVEKQDLSRSSKNISPAILQATFNLVKQPGKKVAATSVLLKGGNYAVIKLLASKLPGYAKAGIKQKNAMKQGIAAYNGQIDYRLYVKSVVANAKVKIYKK